MGELKSTSDDICENEENEIILKKQVSCFILLGHLCLYVIFLEVV